MIWLGLVNDDTSANPKVVLGRVEDPGRIVVKLDNPNVYSITCANIQTAAKRAGKAGVGTSKIGRARRREYRSTNVGAEINFVSCSRNPNQVIG